ncbi:hypothetical protein FRC15_007523, partial [Serendipita sp. 397]
MVDIFLKVQLLGSTLCTGLFIVDMVNIILKVQLPGSTLCTGLFIVDMIDDRYVSEGSAP